ncbi:hypothetical protein [Mesorhizobium sp. M1143]|uniref:hypothetical protein n=1 Tax=Mesorhizobium sp. M1143 TaxID=2957061 RepID=UPI00333AD341
MARTKRLYRADKRLFKREDAITCAGEFDHLQNQNARQTTDFLDALRPAGFRRRLEYLMLFESEECAKNYFVRMDSSERKLYEVEVLRDEIVHWGDMHLVDLINASFLRGEGPDPALAKRYWNSERTDQPCVEVLVPAGKVIRQIVVRPADAARRLKRQYPELYAEMRAKAGVPPE